MAISAETLLSQVRSTAPFIFDDSRTAENSSAGYVRRLTSHDGRELNACEYYAFCLSAHWATAGTFVPTDVDNAIRWRLWQDISTNLIAAQADVVLDSLSWDYRAVTARLVVGADGARLSTHEGTWFSVAAGAYAAARAAKRADLSQRVLRAIREEADREVAFIRSQIAGGDGLEVLKSCALIAHNFGDLDRVADQWELPADDPLRLEFYDAAKPGSKLFDGVLAWAGDVNQRFLAADNHRHYPLRAPRCLRRSRDLLIPVGPFFDDWGRTVARHPALSREDVAEVVRALLDGWVRLRGPVGYARALAGILDVFPGGRRELGRLLPGADRRMLESGALKTLMDVDQRRFEAQWAGRPAQVNGLGNRVTIIGSI